MDKQIDLLDLELFARDLLNAQQNPVRAAGQARQL